MFTMDCKMPKLGVTRHRDDVLSCCSPKGGYQRGSVSTMSVSPADVIGWKLPGLAVWSQRCWPCRSLVGRGGAGNYRSRGPRKARLLRDG